MQESPADYAIVTSARNQIVEKAENVVAIYAAARAASRGRSNPYSSLTALLQQMQREYEDRFLYELIQNAYDAHPADAEGQITILLDELEGEHGVLYVANGGDPFSLDNFESICELAQSNKAPDQAIGNKGVGFKSVLQVCTWPEIFSRTGVQSPGFDGFCFGFTRPEKYDGLCVGDEELAEALRHDVAPYFLPSPIDELPASLQGFADDGFATVIRLPLDSPAALAIAVNRLERLRSETVPLHLFLPRLRRLEIAHVTAGGRSLVALSRDAMTIDDPLDDPDQRTSSSTSAIKESGSSPTDWSPPRRCAPRSRRASRRRISTQLGAGGPKTRGCHSPFDETVARSTLGCTRICRWKAKPKPPFMVTFTLPSRQSSLERPLANRSP